MPAQDTVLINSATLLEAAKLAGKGTTTIAHEAGIDRTRLIRALHDVSFEVPDEVAEALAEAIGTDVETLAAETIYILVNPMGISEIAGQVCAFTRPEAAAKHRVRLAGTDPAANTLTVVPLLNSQLRSILQAQLGHELIAASAIRLDPRPEEVDALLTLSRLMQKAYAGDRLEDALQVDLTIGLSGVLIRLAQAAAWLSANHPDDSLTPIAVQRVAAVRALAAITQDAYGHHPNALDALDGRSAKRGTPVRPDSL